MDSSSTDRDPEPWTADAWCWGVCFEMGLGVIALVVGRMSDMGPTSHLRWPITVGEVLTSFAVAAVLLSVMIGLRFVPWRPLVELRDVVDHLVAPMFRQCTLMQLALLSLAAGWGEELLFRGLIQNGIQQASGPAIAMLIASLLFGLLHLLSWSYFVVAWATSLLFGGLYLVTNSLWPPIFSHALYDFAMLVYLKSTLARAEVNTTTE